MVIAKFSNQSTRRYQPTNFSFWIGFYEFGNTYGQSMIRVYESVQAATKLMQRDKPIRIAKVDGSNAQVIFSITRTAFGSTLFILVSCVPSQPPSHWHVASAEPASPLQARRYRISHHQGFRPNNPTHPVRRRAHPVWSRLGLPRYREPATGRLLVRWKQEPSSCSHTPASELCGLPECGPRPLGWLDDSVETAVNLTRILKCPVPPRE